MRRRGGSFGAARYAAETLVSHSPMRPRNTHSNEQEENIDNVTGYVYDMWHGKPHNLMTQMKDDKARLDHLQGAQIK